MTGATRGSLLAARFATATILLVLLWTAPAWARVPVSVESDNDSTVTTFSVPDRYGCDDDSDAFDSICQGSITVEIQHRGRTVFEEEMTDDYNVGSFDPLDYKWQNCRRAGLYRFIVRAYDENAQQSDSAVGTFRIPRCRKPRSRTVPYGTAGKAAESLAPKNEYVSDLFCEGRGKRVGTRHSRWYCGVRSNNTWRWCDRYFEIDFAMAPMYSVSGEPAWGPMERTYFSSTFHRPECHRF